MSVVLCVLPRLPDSDQKVFVFFAMASKKVLAQGVHSDANTNKRGCGTPVKARVDVPTARVFPVWTKESNMSASFRANAWICVHQPTDRDLERVATCREGECLDMCTAVNRP